MKAITLHQPWASLIAFGLKTIETRRHARFRGLVGETIAIHASKTWDDSGAGGIFWKPPTGRRIATPADFYTRARQAHGCVVAIAGVVAHRRLTEADSKAALCLADGLFGLILDNVRRFEAPIPATGHQGIWTWEPPEGWEEMMI